MIDDKILIGEIVSLKAKQLRYTLFCNILLFRHDFRYCLTMRCLFIVDVSNLICTNVHIFGAGTHCAEISAL